MESLNNQEIEIIGKCLDAVIQGPFLIDQQADDQWWEFPTLIGLEPEEVADIADLWPNVDMGEQEVQTVINNSMNMLQGYPHDCWDEWSDYIPVPPEEVLRVLRKWRAWTRQTGGRSSNEFFDNMM